MTICEVIDMHRGNIMRMTYWEDDKREVVKSHGCSDKDARSMLRGVKGFENLPMGYDKMNNMFYLTSKGAPEGYELATKKAMGEYKAFMEEGL